MLDVIGRVEPVHVGSGSVLHSAESKREASIWIVRALLLPGRDHVVDGKQPLVSCGLVLGSLPASSALRSGLQYPHRRAEILDPFF